MLRLELRLYMYLPTHIQASHYVTPQPGFRFVCYVSPGFPASASLRRDKPPQSGSTTGLPYFAPRRGSDFGGHSPRWEAVAHLPRMANGVKFRYAQ